MNSKTTKNLALQKKYEKISKLDKVIILLNFKIEEERSSQLINSPKKGRLERKMKRGVTFKEIEEVQDNGREIDISSPTKNKSRRKMSFSPRKRSTSPRKSRLEKGDLKFRKGELQSQERGVELVGSLQCWMSNAVIFFYLFFF